MEEQEQKQTRRQPKEATYLNVSKVCLWTSKGDIRPRNRVKLTADEAEAFGERLVRTA